MTCLILLRRKPKQTVEKIRAQLRKWGLRTETRHPHPDSEHMFPISLCQGTWLRYPSKHHLPIQASPDPKTSIVCHTVG